MAKRSTLPTPLQPENVVARRVYAVICSECGKSNYTLPPVPDAGPDRAMTRSEAVISLNRTGGFGVVDDEVFCSCCLAERRNG